MKVNFSFEYPADQINEETNEDAGKKNERTGGRPLILTKRIRTDNQSKKGHSISLHGRAVVCTNSLRSALSIFVRTRPDNGRQSCIRATTYLFFGAAKAAMPPVIVVVFVDEKLNRVAVSIVEATEAGYRLPERVG